MEWAEWLRKTTRAESARKIAVRLNRSHTSVAGWLRGNKVPADAVMEIARAYGADPVAGLIAAGYLSLEEMVPHMRSIIHSMPASFLTEEIHRRSVEWEEAAQEGVAYRPTFPIPTRTR